MGEVLIGLLLGGKEGVGLGCKVNKKVFKKEIPAAVTVTLLRQWTVNSNNEPKSAHFLFNCFLEGIFITATGRVINTKGII